jgi:hypothetical protein
MSTTGASIYSGTIDATTGNLTGNGFALNSTGLKVANGTKSVTISAATGTITANGGSIAGWALGDNTFSKNNIILDSTGNGKIQVGASAQNSVYLGTETSGGTSFLMWAGNNTPDANAKFKIGADGTLYAVGAVFGLGSSIAGYATSTQLTTVSTTATTAASDANTAKIAAQAAKATADAALPSTSFNRDAIVNSINSSATTTTINGGKITTGTVSANAVVSDFISAFNINADKITSGTIGASVSITTPTITVGSLGDSYYFKTKSIRSGTSIEALAVNAINMMSASSAGTLSNWYPYYTDDASLGFVSSPYNLRWRNIFLINSPNVSSDNRYKNNIQVSDLGLDFIKKLNPRKYKLNSRSVKPVIDEDGKEVLHENSDKPVTEPNLNDPGVRNHYGFVAQEVKEALDQLGIYDSAAFWTLADKDDPESSQALVYEQFISPLTKAIQELSNMVESLQQEINTLKGI